MSAALKIEDDPTGRLADVAAGVSLGLAEYLLDPDRFNEPMTRIERVSASATTERLRVERILSNDRLEARREMRRIEAVHQVEAGNFAAIDDTVMAPTPEQFAKDQFVLFTAEKVEGTVRDVRALRRVIPDRLLQLHARGVLDDDTFAACAWYRSRWEEAGVVGTPKTSSYEPQIGGGEPRTDLLPRTEYAWEAWQLYRYARDGIPLDVRALFELVTLDGWALKDAARISHCRFANASGAFRRGALELHSIIRHLLPVRQL